jgi:hypothetical protein
MEHLAKLVESIRIPQRIDHEKLVPIVSMPGSCYPYVGHMFSMGELPGKTVSKWHRELGPLIKIKMGCQYWTIVDDPFLAHKIFVTHGANTSFRPYSTYSYEYYSFKGR